MQNNQKGKWLLHNTHERRLFWCECSVCKCIETHKTPFCPLCGAQMENGMHPKQEVMLNDDRRTESDP